MAVYKSWYKYIRKFFKINLIINSKTISFLFPVHKPDIAELSSIPVCYLKFKDPFASFASHFSHRSISVSGDGVWFVRLGCLGTGWGNVYTGYQSGMSWWHLHVCTRPRYCRIPYNVRGTLYNIQHAEIMEIHHQWVLSFLYFLE